MGGAQCKDVDYIHGELSSPTTANRRSSDIDRVETTCVNTTYHTLISQ